MIVIVKEDHRPQRRGWVPGGSYHCKCADCGDFFVGHKRGMTCADCAYRPLLYVDMDGVLADFNFGHKALFGRLPTREKKGVEWDAIRAIPHFYRDLPPMPDFDVLWHRIIHMNPILLTGVPDNNDQAQSNKREWVDRHIGAHQRMICCSAQNKSVFCESGDILIDDYEKYMGLWKAKGGIWITHVNAEQTCRALAALGK